MSLKEIVDPVRLCLDDGRLNPAAIGYTRTPLHLCNLPSGVGAWGRNKRWEYWGLVTPTHILGLTIASLDYAGVVQIYVLDRRTGASFDESGVTPLGQRIQLRDTLPPMTAYKNGTPWLHFEDTPHGTRIRVESRRVAIDVMAAHGGDALGVVVPWSQRLFQYTCKDVGRPLSGHMMIDGEHVGCASPAWAVLDRGRGRWPRSMTWNWGAGVGESEGHRIGLQLGGKWTSGTGSTENALIVDGRLHYIDEDLVWRYDLTTPNAVWRVSGRRVDATLTPFHRREARTNALIIRSTTYQAFGTWSGWASDATGARYALDGLVGWAEEATNVW